MIELLRTKLFIPRPRKNLVARPRLVDCLNGGLHKKLTLIAAGLLILRETIRRIRGDSAVSSGTKALAAVSLVVWAATIAAGRLLAYTCTRLTVGMSC